MEFIESDTYSDMWVRRNDVGRFTIVVVTLYGTYYITELDINLDEYSEKDLNSYIAINYGSLQDFKDKNRSKWRQMLAEIIAADIDIDIDYNEVLENKQDTSIRLWYRYKINYEY